MVNLKASTRTRITSTIIPKHNDHTKAKNSNNGNNNKKLQRQTQVYISDKKKKTQKKLTYKQTKHVVDLRVVNQTREDILSVLERVRHLEKNRKFTSCTRSYEYCFGK